MKRKMPAKILSLSGHLLYLGPWNHLEPPGTRVSAIGTFGTIWNALQRNWNALGLLERPIGYLEQSRRLPETREALLELR